MPLLIATRMPCGACPPCQGIEDDRPCDEDPMVLAGTVVRADEGLDDEPADRRGER
jgi:hypothetical protein